MNSLSPAIAPRRVRRPAGIRRAIARVSASLARLESARPRTYAIALVLFLDACLGAALIAFRGFA